MRYSVDEQCEHVREQCVCEFMMNSRGISLAAFHALNRSIYIELIDVSLTSFLSASLRSRGKFRKIRGRGKGLHDAAVARHCNGISAINNGTPAPRKGGPRHMAHHVRKKGRCDSHRNVLSSPDRRPSRIFASAVPRAAATSLSA